MAHDKKLRPGSVAYNRAHGLNKAAGGPGKTAAPTPSPAPKPSPSPSATAPREGSVAYNREQGLNKAAGGPGKYGAPASQAVSRAQDYSYDKFRSGSVNSGELKDLRAQGHTRSDIAASARSSGLDMGKAAQRKLDRWDASSARRSEAKDRSQQYMTTAGPRPAQPTPEPPAPTTVTTPTMPPPPPTTMEPPRPDVYDDITVPDIGDPYGGGTSVNPVQDNDMTQQVTQDNDITTTIDGDGNYVYNNQDNSIRQYGGDNRQFTYVGGGNDNRYGGNHLDTPASMATLGGFYDVDDSPAKQAKFMDLYSTMNRDLQKQYAETSHIAQGAIHRAKMNNPINVGALDQRIHEREAYSRAKADMMGMNLFGDMYNYTPPKYQMPDPEKPVETPDFESMYDKYTQF